MEIGIKTAAVLLAVFWIAIHGIVEMSEEIKTNYLTTHAYDLRR